MKVLIAGLGTETNSFSPIPTGRLSFEDSFASRKSTSIRPNMFSAPLHEWRKAAEQRGWELIESFAAFAQPAGPTVREVYEEYRDEILTDLAATQPDIALISMHGAMAADGYDDCEGDLLKCARQALGAKQTVIGVELNPHCHLTQDMLDNADLIVAYKEYPHTDSPDRARELFELAADTAQGKIRPVMRDYDCRMLTMYHTPNQPVRGFVDEMQQREGQGGVLSLSLAHGFPWGDVERVGTRMLAICDGDADQAAAVAEEFGRKLWDLREALAVDWPDIPAAISRVESFVPSGKPLVLADFADNAGGGAPSDSTFVLAEVLRRDVKNIALGIFWDPLLVRTCLDVGEGGILQARIGGKVGLMSGQPIDLSVKVCAIKHKMTQLMGKTTMLMGTGVLLEADGVYLVVSDIRTQTFHPSAFTDLGLDLAALKAVVVKSSQHFYAGFESIAAEIIYIKGPGAITPDYTIIPFTKRDDRYWPKTENPFATK